MFVAVSVSAACAKAEFKAVVALAVAAPPRVAVTATGFIATSPVSNFVARVPVAVGPN